MSLDRIMRKQEVNCYLFSGRRILITLLIIVPCLIRNVGESGPGTIKSQALRELLGG